jgi:hypothetical protein
MRRLDLEVKATKGAAIRRVNRKFSRREAIGGNYRFREVKDQGLRRASVVDGKGANHRRNRQHSHHC